MSSDAVFDPAAGSLKLTRGALADMCALHSGAELSPDALDRLSRAGLVQRDGLHPTLAAIASTASRPLVRLNLDRAAPGRNVHCEGWIDARFALLLSGPAVDAPVFETAFLSRSLLAAQLARMLQLAPRARPKVTDPLEVDHGLLEALVAPGEAFSVSQLEVLIDPRDEPLPAWLEVLATLSTGVNARWRLGVWWNSFEEAPRARSMEVLDSEAGLFFVAHVPRGARRYRRVQLRPVTSSQVWRLLTALVPRPEEVSEPLST
ncbi:MAG: hypothetical protein M3N53_00390 [Actinomycetota bacterium]|nr:hypothetical protein [Actinomycetota bacterium]